MDIEQLEPFLRNCSCFAVLSDEALASVRDRCRVRPYKLGEVVFRQGDPADAMFVVYSGKVRVLRETDGQQLPLNTLFAGEHFGERALVSRQKRSATIRAAADSTLIAIPAVLTRRIVDAVVPSGDLSMLNLVALAMVLVAAVQIGMTAAPLSSRPA